MRKGQNQFSKIGQIISSIVTAIMSGIPSEKVYMRPQARESVKTKRLSLRPDTEKFYHRKISRPVVEKQTLLRETKKGKVIH